MNKNIIKFIAVSLMATSLTSCIKEFDAEKGYVSQKELEEAPKAFASLVDAITSNLSGEYTYSGSSQYANDWGYPSILIQNDIMGQDIVPADCSGSEWFATWYAGQAEGLGPNYALCQMPWTYYYLWIKNCNTVIAYPNGEPTESQKAGVGQAYAMRAMFYLDLARMYSAKTYAEDKNALTVPKITEATTREMSTNNPRMTNEEAFNFILSDLDKAEEYLAGYERTTKYTPDLSVVYGLKARTYLTMEDWVNAEKYAKLAQTGYQVMTADEYTSHTEGFNTANESWMLATRNVATNTNIKDNDGDGSWGAKMTTEQGSGCGYGANYGYPLYIDRHLYETIPSTDCRKKCFVDFAVDSYADENSILEALKVNTDYPELLKANKHSLGGITAKFKNAGGAAGVMDQYVGWCMDIPLMRVEEMKLIEAEAVGMQSGREAEGIQLLTTFAKTRDPQYVYGTHNEAYYNTSTSKFQNEVWWERRTEFWGEGLATYDIKRLKKGIIRSYENSNHPELYRWNMQETPEWMNRCLPRAETSYNTGITENNPTPSAPVGDSPKYNW
jgi:hypothetical protein